MKTFTKLLLAFACMILLAACSKSDEFLVNDSSDANLKRGPVHQGHVFKVMPNGSDDTQSILDAFDQAKAAGPGSVVQLAEGTYKIGFITVWDFSGSFCGAGKGKTIITNLKDLPQGDVILGNSIYPALFKFVGGNLCMTDMTIHINDGNAVAAGDPIGDLYCILFLTDNSSDYIPVDRYIKATVNNVDFIAGYDGGIGFSPFGPTMYNVWSAVMVAADNQWSGYIPKGDISISNCKMENDVFGAWIWYMDNGSSVNLQKNLFTGGAMQILLAGIFGSEIKIKNNQFQKGLLYDMSIDNWNWFYTDPEFIVTKQSQFTITGNYFWSPLGVVSLSINDARRTIFPDEGFPMLCNVRDNNFNTQDGGMAIQSLNNVDAKIWNNKFSGTGVMGVSIDGDASTNTYADNISLIGNNYFAGNYTDASVYLGHFSRNCKVVGVDKDKVIDNGVNNSIIGVKAHKGIKHSGQHHDNDFKSIHEKLMKVGKH